MIWNYTDKAHLTMKEFSDKELKTYLDKISDSDLYAYNVYQIEGEAELCLQKQKAMKIQLWVYLLKT